VSSPVCAAGSAKCLGGHLFLPSVKKMKGSWKRVVQAGFKVDLKASDDRSYSERVDFQIE